MDELPEEILSKIFAFVYPKSIQELTLTCKRFNEIITNNSTLMNAFRIVFDDRREINVDLMLRRKFRKIKISCVDENLMKILDGCGKNISHLAICLNKLEVRDFNRILNFCTNMKQLSVKIFDIRSSNDDLNMPKLTLDALTVERCDKKILRLLSHCSIKMVKFGRQNIISKKSCVKFLRNQKQLKILALENNAQFFILFKDDSLANVDFQLDTFIGDFRSFDQVHRDNFLKFLTNQKSLRSLKVIEEHLNSIEKFNGANIHGDYENYRKLIVPESFEKFDFMPNVEILSLHIYCIKNCQNFHESFPNLNNLSINSFFRIKFVKNFIVPASIDCVEIKIPDNVKTLTINYVKLGNNCLFDDDVEINIEHLSIYDSDNIDWLISCFKNDRINLKSLMIKGTRMKKSQREYFESLTRGENKKIEKLKIYIWMNYDYVYDYQKEDESDDCPKRMKLN